MVDAARAPIYGGIEGGGTKFVCAVGHGPGEILERVTFPTRDPDSTLAECARFFLGAETRHGQIAALGFGCFGPIELRRDSARFGSMLATPKAGWSGADVLGPLTSALDIPIALDVDVGAAALAEWRLGAGSRLGSLAYVTVGTGIGGAAVPAVARLMHAEMGHLRVRRDPRDLEFPGVCPFHGDCLEGLASGPAIQARWGATLDELSDDHEAATIIGGYLGQLAASIALMVAVERIVFGGGVMSHAALLPLVRSAAWDCLNGYPQPLEDTRLSADYICAPALGADAGVAGALLLAVEAADASRSS